MNVNTTALQLTDRAGRLSAPLPRSELEARVNDLARTMGCLLQPAWYTLPFEVAARVARAEVTPSTEDGPLIITRVLAPREMTGDLDWQLAIETGTRRTTTGRVVGRDAFYHVGKALGAALPAPILVERSETLSFEVQMPQGAVTTVGEGFLVYGYHVRGPQGERLPEGLPEAMTAMLGREGQLWLIGLVSDSDDGAAVRVNAQRDCLLERVIFNVDDAGEGQVDVESLRLAVGNTDLFPQGLAGSVIRQVSTDTGEPMVIEGARWPIQAAALIALTPRPENGAGDVADSRCLLICRSPRT